VAEGKVYKELISPPVVDSPPCNLKPQVQALKVELPEDWFEISLGVIACELLEH
jgi:hypothetical protein